MYHLNIIAFKELVIGLPKLKLERNKSVKHAKRENKLRKVN